MSETDVQDDGIGTHHQIQNIFKGAKRKMEKFKNGIQIDEEELGIVKQVCKLEELEEYPGTILDRETYTCKNPERICSKCEYYSEEWNKQSIIYGLKWILEEENRGFGFGNFWKKGTKPQTEEENAGYIISRAIEYLESV